MIKRNGSQPAFKGSPDNFTGNVRVEPMFQAPGGAEFGGASVTFEPGARSAWHTHPFGQTLIVVSGLGWTQCWGEPKEEIRPSDVITCPPDKKHWQQSEVDHVVLGSSTSQVVIVQVPASSASTIHIADPPVRRAQTPVKLVFDVESFSAVRRAVLNLRGGLDPTGSEWVFQGHRVCDGHDPEGNVVQFQEGHQNSYTRADSVE